MWKANAPRGNYKIEVRNEDCNHEESVPCEVMIVKDGGCPERFDVSVPGKRGNNVFVRAVTLG